VATDRRPRVAPAPFALASGRRLLLGERTLVMGIVNVTPDSFHAASRAPRPEEAVERALAQFDAGADIIDVGGESTRPGAASVSEAEEIDRVLPVIEGLRKTTDVVISIDTTKSTVAREAIRAGADIVNDVSGFTADEEMTSVLTETGAVGVLMHMRGTPADMASHARYSARAASATARSGSIPGSDSRRAPATTSSCSSGWMSSRSSNAPSWSAPHARASSARSSASQIHSIDSQAPCPWRRSRHFRVRTSCGPTTSPRPSHPCAWSTPSSLQSSQETDT